ncbi:ABC transporter substrate-binding protein [Pseudonocardia saturnea]|nr:ABC transporter substrate-binding protein [Pseudonocardia autotrophica]GEC28164.1 ABC transporter substrate-binding protein [Pseudonocardia saturnea]
MLVAAALASALVLAGCGQEGAPGAQDSGYEPTVAENVTVEGSPTFDAITQRGRVVIGVRDDQPGLGFRDATTGDFSGFDVEMARMVAGGLGFGPDQIDYRVVPSAAREDVIERGEIDYMVGTYTINDNRKQRVGFAGPYYVAGQSLLVRADDTEITGPETLQGKAVCSVTGSTPIQRVRDDGLTDQIVEFQTYSQCVDQLQNNQVDAVTTDDAILLGFASQNPEQLKVVGDTFSDEPYGIGVPRDDTAFRNKVNDLLQAADDDGTWQTIYDGTLGVSGTPGTPPAIDRY